MKVLVTTHSQMFITPDGAVWTNSVYDYEFFKRYLEVFDTVRLVTRMKKITYDDIGNKLRVDGKGMEFFPLPFYHGPWEYFAKSKAIKLSFSRAILGCDCAILRIPDQVSFQLFSELKKKEIPCAVEVVAHPWDLFSPGTHKTILRPFLRLIWDLLQKKICKKADGVAYVTKNYIQQRYPSNVKVNDKDRFETNYTSANLDNCFFYKPREAKSFKKEVLTLIHVSGINNAAKGHYELLQAIASIKKKGKIFKVIFVGGGTMLNYYKNLSSKLNLSEEVTFLGHISNTKEIANLLKESDLFVFPTKTEGLPRVILEAMAAGLPCISTKVGGIPELISEYCLVTPNNINELEKKLIEITENIDLLEEESLKNYTKVRDEFNSISVQQRRREFYNKLKNKAKIYRQDFSAYKER